MARLLQRRVDEEVSQWKTSRASASDASSHLSPATGLAAECIKYLDSVRSSAPGGGLDLHELAAYEPEGAAYLQQCRQVIEQVATEVGKAEHPKLSDVSASLLGTVALANALPLRADIVDGMQDDSRWLDDVVAVCGGIDLTIVRGVNGTRILFFLSANVCALRVLDASPGHSDVGQGCVLL